MPVWCLGFLCVGHADLSSSDFIVKKTAIDELREIKQDLTGGSNGADARILVDRLMFEFDTSYRGGPAEDFIAAQLIKISSGSVEDSPFTPEFLPRMALLSKIMRRNADLGRPPVYTVQDYLIRSQSGPAITVDEYFRANEYVNRRQGQKSQVVGLDSLSDELDAKLGAVPRQLRSPE